MSIELKVGEWYENRSGERVLVVYDAGDQITYDEIDYKPMVVVGALGGYDRYSRDGRMWGSDDSWLDIDKHLPDCTGWDWVEPAHQAATACGVWRGARKSDLDAGVPVPCRVRNNEDEEWREDILRGFDVWESFPYRVRYYCTPHRDIAITTYNFCQVLDGGKE